MAIIGSLAGCAHFPTPSIILKPSPAEVALQQLTDKQAADLKALNDKIATLSESFKVQFDANISLGSASVAAVYDTMLADPDKDQFDNAEIAGLQVAIKALPDPTLADYKKTSETQRKLLSKQAEELAAGKKEIEEQKALADKSKAEQKRILDEKAAIEKQKADVDAAFDKQKTELQKKIVDEKNADIAKSKQDAIDAQNKKDLQMFIVRTLMIVGVVAGIIAFILKSPLAGIASAGSIALAISVSFLPLSVLIAGLVAVFALIGFPLFREYSKKKLALEHVVGATQDYKNDNPEAFKAGLANNLNEWNASHPAVADTIDKTLKDIRLK